MALHSLLDRPIDVEVSLLTDGRSHFFDLVTRDRDVVAESKAFSWTATGNVPSAKISTLREAVTYLRGLPNGTTRYLIIKRSTHPRKKETLAEYFVRLNEEMLGAVNVLELPEEGGELRNVHGLLAPRREDGGQRERTQSPPAESHGRSSSPPADTVAELNTFRTQLLRILDWLDGAAMSEESIARRISRLYYSGRIPRVTASLMHTVREVRNAAEHDGYRPTAHEVSAARSAAAGIREWAEKNGWRETKQLSQPS